MKKRSALLVLAGVAVLLWVRTRASTPGEPPVRVPDVPNGPSLETVVEPAPGQWLVGSLPEPVRMGGVDDFGEIVAVVDVGDRLFVADARIPPHIAVLDPRQGEVLQRFGMHGEGPGEFRSPSTLRRASAGEGAVWVHDFANRRLSLVRLEGGVASVDREVPLVVATSAERPVRMDDGWIAVGLYGADAVLMFFDDRGHPTRRVGRPPFSVEDVPHGNGIRLVNRSYLAPHPQKERLAVTFYSAGRLDIYSASGELLRSVLGPRQVEPRFEVTPSGGFRWEEGSEMAYIATTASESHILSIFCDCPLRWDDDTMAGTRRRLHAWTWDGDFVGEFDLGIEGVRTLSVSADGTTLYGSVEEPFPQVVAWKLPSELGG